MFFLDPDAPKVHPDWDEAARDTVGILRMAAGRGSHDPGLVRELSGASAAFRRLWASYHVHEKTRGVKRFHRPAVGDVVLRYETFHSGGHLLVVYTAAPGSAAAEALAVLDGA